MKRVLRWASFVVGVLSFQPADAQTGREGRLIITVADQTGAVIPGATVTVTPQEGTNRAPAAPQTTTAQGVVTFPGLPPGRFTVLAEFEGFEPGLVRDVRIRAGDNRQSVALAIRKVEDTVTVSQDPSSAASDRRGSSFGTVLTREQIDALSDDPEEMRRQLADMAGVGAVIKVDSFEGAQLPPKSQIRMIRISRDQFAAENHFAGGLQIDIVTQPGIGRLRGQVSTRLQDGSMTGRSPFVQKKGPERSTTYTLNLSGSLVKEKTSFSLTVGGLSAYDTPNLNVALLSGTRSEALAVRRPRDQRNININLDHALTKDQTLRFGINRNGNSQRNLGVGDYNLPERGYETDNTNYSVRAQHVGPLGRRFFTNSRIQVGWTESATRSQIEAPTVRVIDAFTSGGQQLTGGNKNRTANLASDLDYVRGRHSLRTGIVLDGVWNRSNAASNYLGTYTFESLQAFEENRPRSYTRRIGDPGIDYVNLQGAVYLQDDIRLRPNFTLSPGVRYEVQTHVSDFNNFGPRVGFTWAPGRNGSTSYRASAGIFYDWLGANTYEQTLRVDGFQQRELNIANPSYPDPGDTGFVPPLNRYLLGDGVRMPRQLRFSGGIDRSLNRQSRIGFTYAHLRGTSLQRGRNLNAPVDGVRPNPEFGNIVEVVSDAQSRSDNMTIFFNMSLTRPQTPPAPGAPIVLPNPRTQPLFDWRRASITVQHQLGRIRNNTDGDFSVSPTGSLEQDWGTAAGDVTHRTTVSYSAQMIRNLSSTLLLNLASGSPYTLQTGSDDNRDLIFNDRPAGVARNTERTTGQITLNGQISYGFTFGRAAVNPPTAIGITSVGGVITATTVAVPQQGRYRVNVFVQGNNLTNRANYVGYSGVMTSPFFRRPRDVTNPRRIDMGVTFGF